MATQVMLCLQKVPTEAQPGQKPNAFQHVFASIQSLSANSLQMLEPDYFDVLIIDEFHHAAANTYPPRVCRT